MILFIESNVSGKSIYDSYIKEKRDKIVYDIRKLIRNSVAWIVAYLKKCTYS